MAEADDDRNGDHLECEFHGLRPLAYASIMPLIGGDKAARPHSVHTVTRPPRRRFGCCSI